MISKEFFYLKLSFLWLKFIHLARVYANWKYGVKEYCWRNVLAEDEKKGIHHFSAPLQKLKVYFYLYQEVQGADILLEYNLPYNLNLFLIFGHIQ